ncbi:MAG TPA: hypothetical protein VFT39_21685 [Vicinamibacterales bacterium]|nr:hypothetical protein [Vicinamibacterales bacterium]
MPSDRTGAGHDHASWSRRLVFIAIVTLAALVLVYVARLIDRHTIQVVSSQRLLPRWDLATHLNHGWEDYHLLVTGRIHRLLWDLWLQGYWPPVLSIYQIPFYLSLGGQIESGLRSAIAAFVLTGILGCALMWRQWREAAALPAAIFLGLIVSSPYLLAYASVTMTETVGAATQLAVLLAYVAHRQNPSPAAARGFAVSLTVLFFTKYNYFFLLIAPLVLYEWLDRPLGPNQSRRADLQRGMRFALSSPTVWLLVAYLAGLLVVMRTGGFEFHLAGQRVSVHTVGNSGHVVLYLLLARLWYLHHQQRIAWDRLVAADPRVRPLLVWFALPIVIWFASPYPNHIRDFFNLVINRPLGEASIGGGALIYFDALRHDYFYSAWVLIGVVGVFAMAAVQYRRQPPLMKWLILAIPLQLAVIAIHQTRFPRFLLLTIVLLCVAAACETGRWFAGSNWRRIAGTVLAPAVLGVGVFVSKTIVTEERFRTIAFENYTDNPTLRAAFDSIRAELKPEDRLAIVGHSNELSPALFRWELGPPSGFPCSPFEIGGARGIDLGAATKVLLLMPIGSEPPILDITSYYLAQRQAVLDEVDRGELKIEREIPVPDRHLSVRLYRRTSAPSAPASCE